MSDPTPLEILSERMKAVGGVAWIEEFLVRGRPDGISGAHIVFGWQAPGVMGGTQTGSVGPWAVATISNDPAWEQLITMITANALDKFNAMQTQLQATLVELEAKTTALIGTEAALVTMTADRDGLQTELAAVTAERDALIAQKAG